MISSNDGGGVVSINGGKTWTEEDYPTTQFYHVMTTSDVPYHVAGAQQDNSTLAMPSEGWNHMLGGGPGHGWHYAVGGGESGWITQSPTDPDVFYAGSQGALLTRYNRKTGQTRDIQVYPRFFSGEPASALPERWQWTFPIMFSPLDPKIMYTTSQHVWKTINDGQSWEKISPDLTYADPETLGKTGGVITMDMNGPEIYATVFALAPSMYDVNTIWAGSDDGKVHITRDGGKNWADITPEDLPKFSRISIIDEGKFEPGTLYLAANRYQVDDRQPYVFKTEDFGKSWTKIITGIEDGHFARAIREDLEKPGLLYLATEHGVYVSFNDGEMWQSLQLNLPDTPIQDLVLKNDDVVLGSHGRGFWILDDIRPLRAAVETSSMNKVMLYKSANPIRGIYNAAIQYYLPEKIDSLKIEILDQKGNLINTYISVGDSTAKDLPTRDTGLNTFTWDMRYPGATVFDGMIIWSARPQRGPLAPIGSYQVKLTALGKSHTTEFELEMDPNLEDVTAADLRKQFDLAISIRDKVSEANEAVILIRKIESQSGELDAAQKKKIQIQLKTLLDKLQAIEEELYQVRNQSGQDPLNFPIKLNNRLASLQRSVESGDARPTDAAYVVFAELSSELEGHLSKLDEVLSVDLKKVNDRLPEKSIIDKK
jgi:hypothetical protein